MPETSQNRTKNVNQSCFSCPTGKEIRIFQDENAEAAARVFAGLRSAKRTAQNRSRQQRNRHRW